MILLYSLASAVGAFLLFLVQPMVAKAALPTLGGAPYVWNGCMVFFQGALLAGYLYAHLGSRYLSPRGQFLLHTAALLSALFCFPLVWTGPDFVDAVQSPLSWLFHLLFFSVGLPFVVVAATAPLLQRWFSKSGHARAHNPYFLYAASNAGSFAALLGYPFFVEPQLALPAQATLMQWGYIFLAVLLCACGWTMRRKTGREEAVAPPSPLPLSARIKFRWVLLAFVPSSLLYGVTTYITTDIASVPMLWVLPLALYLLTFIFAFAATPLGVHFARRWSLFSITLLALFMVLPMPPLTGILGLHLIVFFIVCLACHGTLNGIKPGTERLTEFYLWLSFGGVLGGMFNTLLAPVIFTQVIEYKLAVLLAVLALASAFSLKTERGRILEALLGTLVALGTLALLFVMPEKILPMYDAKLAGGVAVRIALLVCAGTVVWLYARFHSYRLAFTLGLGLMLLTVPLLAERMGQENVLFSARNFFGVNRVAYSAKKQANQFWHGTTNHGAQSVLEEDRLQPVAYYAPLKQVFAMRTAAIRKAPIAVMGLGVGTVACYGEKNQKVDFFEIDPLVEAIARNKNFFTYLSDCPPDSQVILGDARLKLQEMDNARYGVMIMDAFSSDSIPVHLITREALEIYLAKLAPHGLIAYNISNRHIELKPVLAAQAKALGLVGASRFDDPLKRSSSLQNPAPNRLSHASEWVVLAREEKDIAALMDDGWKPLPDISKDKLWTDQHSNLVGSLKILR